MQSNTCVGVNGDWRSLTVENLDQWSFVGGPWQQTGEGETKCLSI